MGRYMKEYPLKGVRTHELNVLPDERGFFAEALRQDWNELLEDGSMVQANISYSYPNVVRAWHRHERGQTDYFLVLRGAMKICAYEEETGRMAEIIASDKRYMLVGIPGRYLHGTRTVSAEPSLTIYFVTRLYDYHNPDEIRRPWDDPTVVPMEINGRKDDPRVCKPWNWFYPPYK